MHIYTFLFLQHFECCEMQWRKIQQNLRIFSTDDSKFQSLQSSDTFATQIRFPAPGQKHEISAQESHRKNQWSIWTTGKLQKNVERCDETWDVFAKLGANYFGSFLWAGRLWGQNAKKVMRCCCQVPWWRDGNVLAKLGLATMGNKQNCGSEHNEDLIFKKTWLKQNVPKFLRRAGTSTWLDLPWQPSQTDQFPGLHELSWAIMSCLATLLVFVGDGNLDSLAGWPEAS